MSIPFEPRFGKAAEAYRVFRPSYPQVLFDRILAALPAAHRDRAMDLGAGTGQIALALVPLFREVIAVEPDAAMAAEIQKANPQILVRTITAEDCQQDPGSFDLITIATALHWMDGSRVLANVARWLRPTGILAAFGYPFPRAPDPLFALIRQELREHWDAFRHPRLRDRDYSTRVLHAAENLDCFDECTIPYVVHLSPRDFAGFWSSTSYGSAYSRTLADPASYWQNLESRFRECWPDGKIPVEFNPWLILVRRSA